MPGLADDIIEERARLVETLEFVGPEAPTLVEGWSAQELARHLAAQDRLRGVPALVARRLVVATQLRLTAVYLDRPVALALVNSGPRSWAGCLQRLRQPPPRAVTGASVGPITLWEHVVHHEDLRRASSVRRTAWPDLTAVIDWLLAYNRRRLNGPGVRLVDADSSSAWSSRPSPAVTVTGPPSELVLWLSGRPWAEVQVDGAADDVSGLGRRLAI